MQAWATSCVGSWPGLALLTRGTGGSLCSSFLDNDKETLNKRGWECRLLEVSTPRESAPSTAAPFPSSGVKSWAQLPASLWEGGEALGTPDKEEAPTILPASPTPLLTGILPWFRVPSPASASLSPSIHV